VAAVVTAAAETVAVAAADGNQIKKLFIIIQKSPCERAFFIELYFIIIITALQILSW
jgi:hypothetical protein